MNFTEKLIAALWSRRWLLAASAACGAVLATIYVLVADRTYTAEVVTIPALYEPQSGFDIGEALGGFGAIAGIMSDQNERVNEALAVIRSRTFIESFISENNLLTQLFAEEWNSAEEQWRHKETIPSLWDGYDRFTTEVFAVSRKINEGTITIEIRWTDPVTAAGWANDIVAKANRQMRNRAIHDATASIEFLEAELKDHQIVEIRQGIFRLIETQINQIMLAKVHPDFAFEIIDPALPKDLDAYDYPRAVIMVPAGMIAGAGVFVLFFMLHVIAPMDSARRFTRE